MDDDLGEEMKCLICLDYLYQPVTLIDCLHNFCGACYSEWMQKSDICPFCKKKVISVKKNIAKHPDKKRDKNEYDEMETKNKISIESQTLKELKKTQGTKKQTKKPAPQGQPSACCQECNIARDDGFKCVPGQKHFVCINCMKKFPNREDPKFKQQCLICNNQFCNLYWDCPGKKPNKLLEIKDHKIPLIIDNNIFRQNKFELDTFKKFLAEKKYSTKNVFDFMLKHVLDKGQFQYKADKSILPNFNQQFQLLMNMKGDSPICINCFPLVWSQIIFRYRIKIKDQLPDEIKKRSSCWYGINCSTATHNEDHQKKLDHVCEQVKFK